MKAFLPIAWAGLVLVLTMTLATADAAKDKPKGKTIPEGAPLGAELVAKTTKFKLDLGGRTAAEFRKLLMEAETSGQYPPPPAVDLRLTIYNTSEKALQIWASGDPVVIVLKLEGPGAVSVSAKKAFTREFRIPMPATLAPRKANDREGLVFEIKSLTYGFRGVAEQAYWIEPGDYTLTATLRTAVSPAPKGAKDAQNGFGYVTVTSTPIPINVEAK
jgi:hypothetical protein